MDGVITSGGKISRNLVKIWFPLSLFALFMVMVVGKEELYDRFLSNFSDVGRIIFDYGSQIGV